MWRKKMLDNGHQLFLHESPGKKGTIIGVPDLTGHHMQLGHFQKAFEGQYRMITYDLRGRGKSSEASTDTSVNHHVEDLVYLIHALKVKRPILMGYSFGAYICLKAATLIDRVSAVILMDGAVNIREVQKELWLNQIVQKKKYYPSRLAYLDETRLNYEKWGVRWTEHMNRLANYEVEKQGEGWNYKSNTKLLEQDLLSLFEFEVENVAPKVNAPVLLIHAEGNMGKRPFISDNQVEKLEANLKNIEVVKNKANHLSLAYNRQIELEWKLLKFLNETRNVQSLK